MEYEIYFICLFICTVTGLFFRLLIKKKDSKIEFIIIYTLLFLVSALRTIEVGADTRRYFEIFDECSQIDFAEIFDMGYEPAYVFINKVISVFTTDAQWVLIISSIFVIYGIGTFFYRYSNNCLLATLLFIGLGVYSYLFTPIRHAMAIPFLLYGMHCLWCGKKKYSIICIILASMFHYSSLIFIIFILGHPYNQRKMILSVAMMTGLCWLFLIIGREYFDLLLIGKYAGYNTIEESGSLPIGAGIVRVFIFMGVAVLGWYTALRYKTNELSQYVQKYYVLSLICYCGALVVFLGYQISFLSRYDVSFWAFVCLLISLLYTRLSQFWQVALYPFMFLVITVYMYGTYYFRCPLEQVYHDIFGIF